MPITSRTFVRATALLLLVGLLALLGIFARAIDLVDDVLIARIDAAARIHQCTGRELDLIMADHHEHFDAAAITQQQDGGRGTCDGGFG